ncbi:MAG: hypothetical protein K8F25_16155, partial [Fimbriimonadaceae bacterium]|nr:hypothetical protein [Alphaproteobacteria bacterium]
MNDQRQIVSVLPAVAVDGPYSYSVPPERGALNVGDIVLIPLGSRKELGLVWKNDRPAKKIAPANLRPIAEHIDTPPLSSELVEFIDWVAN